MPTNLTPRRQPPAIRTRGNANALAKERKTPYSIQLIESQTSVGFKIFEVRFERCIW